jgi:predicted DNA-binding WGR domain protein
MASLSISTSYVSCELKTTRLQRIDAARNMARFYIISIEPTLFGDWALVRNWGRIGRPGKIRIEMRESIAIAQKSAAQLIAAKERRGYRQEDYRQRAVDVVCADKRI